MSPQIRYLSKNQVCEATSSYHTNFPKRFETNTLQNKKMITEIIHSAVITENIYISTYKTIYNDS